MPYIFLIGFLLLVVGFWFLQHGRDAQHASGLPTGKVIYSDTSSWQPVEQSLINQQHGLVGKPDYVLTVSVGRTTETIPVEVKSARQPITPHWGHILQLGAYCLLVEAHYGQRPSHGLLHYADATLQIPFTKEIEAAVLEAATAIRQTQTTATVRRNHDESARCRACGYRDACGKAAL